MRCASISVGVVAYEDRFYRESEMGLRYAVDDARAFSRYAATAGESDDGQHFCLVDGEATSSGVTAAFDEVAAGLRTLQRRLKDAGVNCSDLRNDVHKTLALNLLQNETLALAEIAFSLGYSEVSAFNHAFRRWVGQSPGHYRRLRAAHFKSAAAKKSEPPARGSI